VTYMYHGTVSVAHHLLQSFLHTAEALKIKGIVDTSCEEEELPSPPPLPAHPLPPLPTLSRAPSLLHPVGDLSLLALAATETGAKLEGAPGVLGGQAGVLGGQPGVLGGQPGVVEGLEAPPRGPGVQGAPAGVKRRKTAPRKLASFSNHELGQYR